MATKTPAGLSRLDRAWTFNRAGRPGFPTRSSEEKYLYHVRKCELVNACATAWGNYPSGGNYLRELLAVNHPMDINGRYPASSHQFADGNSALTTKSRSAAAVRASNFSPSCCCTAVKIETPPTSAGCWFAVLSGDGGFRFESGVQSK
jgi:hypothetical protein